MIYLDNAATTRPDEAAVDKALEYLKGKFFNPSSLYREGFEVHREMETARKNVMAHVVKNDKYEMIFTSCGSEADNMALFSCARRGNLVITKGEHAAIYNSAAALSKLGTEVRYAELNADGSVNEDSLLSLIDVDTRLVSVIHVNNETGAINNILDLSAKVKKKNPSAVFHSDGVQAFGKIPFNLDNCIDLYTISAHKIGGIRGVAGLIKRKSLTLHPLIYGGGQEKGLRGGTENVFSIKQFEYAAEKKFSMLKHDFNAVQGLNAYLRNSLSSELFEILSSENASPYILSVSAKGLRGEILLHMLNDEGLIVGTGSACSSKNRYSRVMLACGLTEKRADGVLRLSFSPSNTEEEVKEAASLLNQCAQLLKERMQ